MKANAPEKIYLSAIDLEEVGHLLTEANDRDDVEYTRTDAFIEKACVGIDHLLSGYIIRNFHFGDSYNIDKLIEDFKNFMKGE